MVEVGLILPIFLITLLAIVEFGWYSAVAAATSSASREGARYGSTVGDDPVAHYIDCDGIRAAARSTTDPLITLADSDITITYDNGTGTPVASECDATPPLESELDRWDRIVVRVEVTYEPLVPLLDALIGTHELVSIDRRSIVKVAP